MLSFFLFHGHSASRVSMNCTTLAAHQLVRGEQRLLLSGLQGWKGEAVAAGVKTNRSLVLICHLTPASSEHPVCNRDLN